MTVDELIAKLQALPAEDRRLQVWTEGCDCHGKAADICKMASAPGAPAGEPRILIERLP